VAALGATGETGTTTLISGGATLSQRWMIQNSLSLSSDRGLDANSDGLILLLYNHTINMV